MVSGPYLDFDPQPFVKASILFLALLLNQHADGQSPHWDKKRGPVI